ncbi:MAG: hypothetical protein DMF79_04995 [Acidobacteria bacterium]|nr:MAG: hypothetical protein DMF79_04995 [Acidobacteriota bacterium]
MIITCPSCQSRYKFDESRLGDRPKVKTRCAKCGGSIEIENPMLGAFTLPPGNMSPAAEPPAVPSQDPPELQTKPNVPTVPGPPQGGGEEEVGGSTVTGRDLHKMGVIELPKDKRFSLAVIQGAATGQIFQITKTRTTVGRSGADVNLDDPEASRQHAALEILGETAVLRDLGSTNGTFIDIDRIEQHQITNQMEFRIGSHVLMFIVTEVE